jgi:3-dehydroquinate dehydratase/shikimate dehydrogenase
MYPNAGECYFGEDDPIPADLVFDMVYNPEETALLRRARSEKRQVIGGLEMFIEQAVQQFELWTGMTAPRSAMESAAREALAGRA